jgi:hypothetical protein
MDKLEENGKSLVPKWLISITMNVNYGLKLQDVGMVWTYTPWTSLINGWRLVGTTLLMGTGEDMSYLRGRHVLLNG